MELHSADSWRGLFLYSEKIYVSTGDNRRKVLGENDEEIWEYLRSLRLDAEKYKTTTEMIALQSKAMIMDNLIHGWARDLLEKCPRIVKKMRTEPEEDVMEVHSLKKGKEIFQAGVLLYEIFSCVKF